jgi:hypothetical protein
MGGADILLLLTTAIYRVIQNLTTILKEVVLEIIWSRKCR